MVILATKGPKQINPLEAGMHEGIGDATTQAANTNLLLELLEDNYSVLFPAGLFEFDDSVDPENVSNVVMKGVGVSTILRSLKTGIRFFYFRDCTNVQISDMTIQGNAWSGGTWVPKENSNVNRAGVAVYRSRHVRLERLNVTGVPGSAIHVEGCLGVHITNNRCWGNEGNEVGVQLGSNDIRVTDNDLAIPSWGAPLPDISREIIIANNQCLSNSHVGIEMVEIATRVTVANNQVVAMQNADLVSEATTIATNKRKEAIILHYDTDENQAATGRAECEFVCTGNLIKNCGWSGIYCNSNDVTLKNPGGILGTISNNVIINSCLANQVSLENYKRNAITVEQCRDVSITGNVIRKVNTAGTGVVAHAGILYSLTSAYTPKQPTSGAKRSRAIISGNNIADTQAGIYITNDVSEVDIVGNVVQDATERMLATLNRTQTTASAKLGELNVVGNRFVSSKIANQAVAVLITNTNGETKFANNTVDVSEATSYGTSVTNMVHINDGVDVSIDNNTFRGNGNTLLRLLRIDDFAVNEKAINCRVRNNSFRSAAIGIWNQVNGATDAIYVDEGNRFTNVTTPRNNATGVRGYPGRHLDGSTFELVVNNESDKPTTAHLVQGDRVFIKNETKDGKRGWHRDASGLVGLPKEYLNADQYDIPRDGVTDCVPAIQAMINDAASMNIGRCILPPRTYAWLTQLDWPTGSSSVLHSIALEGNGSTINVGQSIRMINRAWPDATVTTNNSFLAYVPRIRQLNVIGFNPSLTGGNPTSNGIFLRQCNQALIEDCTFRDMDTAIQYTAMLSSAIRRVRGHQCRNHYKILSGRVDPEIAQGTETNSASNLTILEHVRAQCTDTAARGFLFQHAGQTLMQNCTVDGSDFDTAVEIDDSPGIPGYIDEPTFRCHGLWIEQTGNANRVFKVNARDLVFDLSHLHVKFQFPGLVLDATDSQGTIFLLKSSSCWENISANPPSQRWFTQNSGVGFNSWRFENNRIKGAFTSFLDADLWSTGGVGGTRPTTVTETNSYSGS